MRNLPQSSFDDDPFTQLEKEISARQLESEDTRRKRQALFSEGVAVRERRLMERALAVILSKNIFIYYFIIYCRWIMRRKKIERYLRRNVSCLTSLRRK